RRQGGGFDIASDRTGNRGMHFWRICRRSATMIAVMQRVSEASVKVGAEVVGAIGVGLVALVAVCGDDADADVAWMARKLVEMRIFAGGEGKHFDLDIRAVGG